MKWILIFLFLLGCSHQKTQVTQDKSNFDVTRTPASVTTIETDSPIFALYAGKIKDYNPQEITWKADKLPFEYHMPSAGPLGPYYNTDIIWAQAPDGKIITGFRPVNTTTGCNSGCTPVVFHLQFNEKGEVLDLFEEKDHQLRKLNHKTYEKEDLEKAKTLAKTLPEALQMVDEPKQVANELTKFPPQTWVAYKDLLVGQSAYTSFRIFEAANQIKAFLALSPYQKNRIQQEVQFAQNLITGNITGIKQLRQSLAQLNKILDSKEFSNDAKKFILSNPSNILLNLVNMGDNSDLSSIKKFLGRSYYQTTHKLTVCEFYQDLLNFPKGQNLLLNVAANSDQWPTCEENLDKLLPLFAATMLDKKDIVEKLSKNMNLSEIPPIVLDDPDYIVMYFNLARILDNKPLQIKSLAEGSVRYPNLDLKEKIDSLNDAEKKEFSENSQRVEKEYRKEFHRKMLQEPINFPIINGTKGEGVLVTLPLQTKQVYVFFASWCPHCRAAVTSWIKSEYGKEFWDKIQLVEVFPKTNDDTIFDEFCKVTGITEKKPEICAETVRLSTGPKVDEFYEKIALTGVPKIIITHKDGRIGIFDYQIPHKKGQDLLRDLNWIIEELPNLK
jgi:thiol-disulfide isomerase/thioredoxin